MTFRGRARRVIEPALHPQASLARRRRIASASRRVARSEKASPPERVAVVSTYRIQDANRLRILEATVRHLSKTFSGSTVPFVVRDASDPLHAQSAHDIWSASGLPTDWQIDGLPLVDSLEGAVGALEEPYFCLQFDDMLTVGMDPSYLAAATQVLGRFSGDVGVVCPVWPLKVELRNGVIEIEAYETGPRGALRFRDGVVRPVEMVTIDERRFAIFENFTYGFFFNALVAPVDDFLFRLSAFRAHAATSSAHAIELFAAAKSHGPWWTHIAVCLDGVSLLDLDFAHTSQALRLNSPEVERLVEALENGSPIRVRPPA